MSIAVWAERWLPISPLVDPKLYDFRMNDLTFPFDACGQEGEEEEEGRDRG